MSDLCHNCGSCHLPQPCARPLITCDICNNAGHSYNFCPLSVWLRDRSYTYWMLCHNCDNWHLPQPCKHELHKCAECGAGGHLEMFCPIKPRPRETEPAVLNGNKRQRPSDFDATDETSAFAKIEEKRLYRIEVTKQVIDLLKMATPDNVIHIMSQTIDIPALHTAKGVIGSSVDGTGSLNRTSIPQINSGNVHNSNDTVSPFGNAYVPISKQIHSSPLNPPTPASTTTRPGSRSDLNGGIYTTMHERFQRGELGQAKVSDDNKNAPAATDIKPVAAEAVNTLQPKLPPMRPFLPSQPGTNGATPEPIPKKKRAAPRARCEECKTKKKKCTHGELATGVVSRTPSYEMPPSIVPTPTTQPSQSCNLAAAVEHSTSATMPDSHDCNNGLHNQHPFTMPNELLHSVGSLGNEPAFGAYQHPDTFATSAHEFHTLPNPAQPNQSAPIVQVTMPGEVAGEMQSDASNVHGDHGNQFPAEPHQVQHLLMQQQLEAELRQIAKINEQAQQLQHQVQLRQLQPHIVGNHDVKMHHVGSDQAQTVQTTQDMHQKVTDEFQPSCPPQDVLSDDPPAEAAGTAAGEGADEAMAAPKKRGRPKRKT